MTLEVLYPLDNKKVLEIMYISAETAGAIWKGLVPLQRIATFGGDTQFSPAESPYRFSFLDQQLGLVAHMSVLVVARNFDVSHGRICQSAQDLELGCHAVLLYKFHESNLLNIGTGLARVPIVFLQELRSAGLAGD